MKKQSIICTVIAVAAMTLVSCNKTDLVPEIENTTDGQPISFTATLAPKSGALTKALDEEGHKNWAVGEKIEIWEDIWSTGMDIPDDYESVLFIGTVTAVDARGRASITGTLPKEPISDSFIFSYPYYDEWNLSPEDLYFGQDGEFDTIAQKYDYADGTGTLVLDGLNATIDGDVAMENRVCITSYRFVDESANDITAVIERLSISGENSAAGWEDYLLRPSASARAAGKLYVAMRPNEGPTSQYMFRIKTTDGGVYTTSVKRASLEAGKLYGTATFTMHRLAVGDLLYSDGGFYSSAQPALGDPVGIVGYLDDPSTDEDDEFTGGSLGLVFQYTGEDDLAWMAVNPSTNPAKVEFGDENLFDPETAAASDYLTPTDGYHRTMDISINAMNHEMANRWKYPAFKYALEQDDSNAIPGCGAWGIPTVQQSYLMLKTLFGYTGEAKSDLKLGPASGNVSTWAPYGFSVWTSTEASAGEAVYFDLLYWNEEDIALNPAVISNFGGLSAGDYTLSFAAQAKDLDSITALLVARIPFPIEGEL